MHDYSHDSFHLPRKPLIQKTIRCIYLVFAGLLVIALTPNPDFKPAGAIPILWSLAYWHYLLLPKWNFVVEVDLNSLKVGSSVYPWSTLHSLKLEHKGASRFMQLVFVDKGRRYDLILGDELLNFEELARLCFWHANDVTDTQNQSNSGFKISTSTTKAEG